ncbi:hypothetical protein [Mycolicibacter minnesotensis]
MRGTAARWAYCAGVAGVAFLAAAPCAHAYSSWCDVFETHGARVAVVTEPLRGNPGPSEIGRLNSLYDNVIPVFGTVAYATFWYPDVWGSPDIRPEMTGLIGAMRDLQGAANAGQPTGAEVQAVDDRIGELHRQCVGKRELPPPPGPPYWPWGGPIPRGTAG